MKKKTAKHYPCKLPPFVRTDCLSCLSVEEVKQQLGWSITAFNLPDTWNYTQGEGVVIAVLDTGCDLTHEDLKDNLLEGKNFVQPGKPPEDDCGHGSHVTGILVADNNNFGMVGVAPKAKVRPVKVLDKDGNGNMALVSQEYVGPQTRGVILYPCR